LIEYFGGMTFSGGTVTCPVDDPTPLRGAAVSLDSLPSHCVGHSPSQVYLLAGGKLGEYGAGAGCDGPIAKIARDIHVQKAGAPVVTLVDFKAGFEDTARGVVTRMDWALVVVDPTQASIVMATQMKKMVERLHAGCLPATRHLESPELVGLAARLFREAPLRGVLFVLNRIADDETEAYLRRRLAACDISPIAAIRNDPEIERAWLTGTAIKPEHAKAEQLVERLERAVAAPAAAG
jgi:CO dehydrogenase nickel-insertion accessory protein CooC1